jgi:hypothetical protein
MRFDEDEEDDPSGLDGMDRGGSSCFGSCICACSDVEAEVEPEAEPEPKSNPTIIPDSDPTPFNSSDNVRETAITLAPKVFNRILVIDRPRPLEAPVSRVDGRMGERNTTMTMMMLMMKGSGGQQVKVCTL